MGGGGQWLRHAGLLHPRLLGAGAREVGSPALVLLQRGVPRGDLCKVLQSGAALLRRVINVVGNYYQVINLHLDILFSDIRQLWLS